MPDPSSDPLSILAGLAQEYQQKYKELAEAIQNAQKENTIQLLKARAEVTTSRFRTAQQVLLSELTQLSAGEDNNIYRAAIAICRCFDEMRIVYQFLLEHSPNQNSGNTF